MSLRTLKNVMEETEIWTQR